MERRPRSSPMSASSSSSFSSSSSSSCSASPLSSPCILSPLPTTICAQVPDEDRTHSALLRQTELVYDQLLAERQRKLQQRINERQTEYNDKYTQLLAQADRSKAAEFERWAAVALRQLRDECLEELSELRQDYEAKFVKLQLSLDDQRTVEHRKPSKTVHFQPQQQQHHQYQQQQPFTAAAAGPPLQPPTYLRANRY